MQEHNATNDEAQHFVRKMLLFGDSEIVAAHQWVSEVDRWKELAFALLTRTTSLPQTTVRVVTDTLVRLELLDIHRLPGLIGGKPTAPDYDNPYSRRILQTLLDGGFSNDEATKGLTVICEAAAGLGAHYSGRIQLYLRSYGERMVDEAQTIFHFSQMDQPEVKYAITLWLQNVMHMPLSLQDKAVEAFGHANGLTASQIFDAADELDINVALVDDLLHHFHSFPGNVETDLPGATRSVGAKRQKRRKAGSHRK